METVILEFRLRLNLEVDYLFYEKRERPWIYISMCPYMLTEIPKASQNVAVEGKSGVGDTGGRESSLSVPFCTLWIWNHVNVQSIFKNTQKF